MKNRKPRDINDDERMAPARFVDQPGQWIDCTPASVKKKQKKAWDAFLKSMNK